jgi:hypothetical protein
MPPAVPGVDPSPAAAVIEVGIEADPVDAVNPIEGITVVEATESIPVKPAEPMNGKPVTAEVETSEAAEVASSEVASSEMATEVTTASVTPAKMTTAAMATASIRNLRQCNQARDEHRGHERDKLHDTLLLDGDLLVATEALRKWRS